MVHDLIFGHNPTLSPVWQLVILLFLLIFLFGFPFLDYFLSSPDHPDDENPPDDDDEQDSPAGPQSPKLLISGICFFT